MVLNKAQVDKIMWKLKRGDVLWAHEFAYLQETLDYLFFQAEIHDDVVNDLEEEIANKEIGRA